METIRGNDSWVLGTAVGWAVIGACEAVSADIFLVGLLVGGSLSGLWQRRLIRQALPKACFSRRMTFSYTTAVVFGVVLVDLGFLLAYVWEVGTPYPSVSTRIPGSPRCSVYGCPKAGGAFSIS